MLLYRRRKLEPEAVESICLDVTDSKKSRLIVCAYYRLPKFCKISYFISSLISATELIYKSRKEIILLEDFNIDIIDDGKGTTVDNSLFEFCEAESSGRTDEGNGEQ